MRNVVFVAAMLVGATGCVARGQLTVREPVLVYVEEEPPPPRVETRPAIGVGYIWIDGRWDRHGNRWTWQNGRSERAPAGKIWSPGRWEKRGKGHVWIDGRWRTRPGHRKDY